MKTSYLFLGLVALALIALAFFVLASEESADEEVSAASAGHDVDQSSLAPAHPIRADAVESPDDSQIEREEVTVDEDDRTFLLTVLNGETDQPMPNIEVYWKETPWGEYIPKADYDRILLEEGTISISDAQGQVRLPWNEHNIDMMAKEGVLYRALRRSPNRAKEEHILRLERDREVTVTVLHADGSPAVDVRVSHLEDRGSHNTREVGHQRTDENGIAKFHHHQDYLRWLQKQNRQYLVIGIASLKPPKHDFSVEEGLPASMEFTLPPVAEVHIYAFQEDGSPYTDESTLSLQARAADEVTQRSFFGGDRFDQDSLHGWDRRDAEDGHARFLAALHEELVFALHHPHHDADLAGRASGPTLEGETLRLELQLQEALCFLVGRLLGPQGKPIADTSIRGRLTTNSRSGGLRFQTDAGGKFRLGVDQRKLSQGDALINRLSPLFRDYTFLAQPEPGIGWVTQLEISRDLEPGENEVGDLIMGTDIVLSGQVVDAAGVGVPTASLQLKHDAVQAEEMAFREQQRSILGTSWLQTDKHGLFEIRSTTSAGAMQLSVRKSGFQPQQLKVNAGSRDLRIVLQGENQSYLEIIPPEGLEAKEFRIYCRQDGVGGTQVRRFSDNHLELGFLAEGTHTIDLHHTSFQGRLLQWENVSVGPGIAQDPRLSSVDLEPFVTALRLKVIQPDHTIADTFFFHLDQSRNRHDGKGDAAIVLPKSVQTLTIWTEEGRAVQVTARDGEQEVSLPPPLKLNLSSGNWPKLDPGQAIQIQMNHISGLAWLERKLTEPGATTLLLPHKGGYNLSMSIVVEDPQTGNTKHLTWLELDGATRKEIQVDQDETNLNLEINDTRVD